MSGLRFCMITTFYPPFNFGGDGIGIQRLSQALVRRGHHVTVLQDVDAYLALSHGSQPPGDDPGNGVHTERFRSRLGPLSLLLTHQLGRPSLHRRRIRQLLARGSFDVINYHNISLVGGPGILDLGDALKLYMAHEHWLVCPTHVLWRHQREACTGRQCLRCVLHYRRSPQIWRYTGYLTRRLRQVDAFIAMSEFSRSKHREFGFPAEMEVVNYFLPDLPTASTGTAEPSPHERPYFLFVGRLERLKGLDEVIEVCRSYAGADLLVAGDGEDGERLRSLAGGVENVIFLGRISPDRLDTLYRHALALIVPSIGFETFGIILIEAFRQGTPVLARRLGPFPEIIERCGGGMLFAGPEDLAAAMHRIQDDSGWRDDLARRARRGFADHWSESAVVPRYLDVVRRAAAAKGREHILAELGGNDSV